MPYACCGRRRTAECIDAMPPLQAFSIKKHDMLQDEIGWISAVANASADVAVAAGPQLLGGPADKLVI